MTLAAQGRKPDELAALARETGARFVAVIDPRAAQAVRRALPAEVRVAAGAEALLEAATHPEVDRVVAAIVGAAGLPPVHAALAAGKGVALANKESMVVAGPLLNAVAAAGGAEIVPVDSEHSALHQALRGGRPDEVRRLLLTASGGPFLRRDGGTFAEILVEEALAHPTWSMGAKITIDSATLINKGLELIEAAHLFAMPAEKIDVVVHPQSIVHSFVEFIDGSLLAQLSVNDMIFPVQYALAYPERWENSFPRLDPAELGKLEFLPLDRQRFPAVELARAALLAGASAPAVFNAANEEAVHAFLDRRIRFPAIVETSRRVLEEHHPEPVTTLEAALAWDAWGRVRAREVLVRLAR